MSRVYGGSEAYQIYFNDIERDWFLEKAARGYTVRELLHRMLLLRISVDEDFCRRKGVPRVSSDACSRCKHKSGCPSAAATGEYCVHYERGGCA